MKMKSVRVIVLSQLLYFPFFLFAQSDDASPGKHYLKNLFDHSILFDTTRLDVVEVSSIATDSLEAWKQWHTVENYTYGKDRGSLPMIADLNALHPYFRDKIIELINVCKKAGITLAIVESYRTPAKQAEYFAMGDKYTSTPGGKSRHQYGLAVDVVPIVDSVAVWDNHKLWKKIGIAGERLGLRWGGRWRVLYDPGHFEWLGGLSRQELAKGYLPRIPSSVIGQYPMRDEALKELQTFWQAWEVEQSMTANNRRLKGDGKEATIGTSN